MHRDQDKQMAKQKETKLDVQTIAVCNNQRYFIKWEVSSNFETLIIIHKN